MPFEEAHFEAILKKNLPELGTILAVETPKQWTTFKDMEDALPFFYESYQLGTSFGSFFIVHKKDKQLLGTCGFKGNPDTEGVVELGYEIHKDYRLQGLATEAAQGLMDYAFRDINVKKIRAHTLPFGNPSSSVLQKLAFIFLGTFHDPDDGDVWRWEIKPIIAQ